MLLLYSDSGLKNISELICAVLLFFVVLLLAYFAARIAGSFQSNVVNRKSNIRVIEAYRISNNKMIEIVKIGDKYLALAITKDHVSLLTELNEDSINEQSKTIEPIHFSSLLEKIKNEKQNKSNK